MGRVYLGPNQLRTPAEEDTGLRGSCSSSGGLVPSWQQHLKPAGAHTNLRQLQFFLQSNHLISCFFQHFCTIPHEPPPPRATARKGRGHPGRCWHAGERIFFPLIKAGLWLGKGEAAGSSPPPHTTTPFFSTNHWFIRKVFSLILQHIYIYIYIYILCDKVKYSLFMLVK